MFANQNFWVYFHYCLVNSHKLFLTCIDLYSHDVKHSEMIVYQWYDFPLNQDAK